MKQRTSFWFTIKKEVLEEAVKKCFNFSEILRHFNFPRNGSNLKNLKERISIDNIDISHFETNSPKRRTNNELFKENSMVETKVLKTRILKDGLKPYKCSDCNLEGKWNGKELVLQLDHINGIRTDNRLNNLRFLCPNCHSQTSTFGSKNLKKEYKKNNRLSSRRCRSCGKKVLKKSRGCVKCFPMINKNTPVRFNIEKEKLKELLEVQNINQIAKDYGVSFSTVKKRCKKLGLWFDYQEKVKTIKEESEKVKNEFNFKKELKLKENNERDKMIEKLFLQNKTSLEISRILNVPRTTVRDCIKRIIKK